MKILTVLLISMRAFVICGWDKTAEDAYDKWQLEFGTNSTCDSDLQLSKLNFMMNFRKVSAHNQLYKKTCNMSYDLGLWANSYLTDDEMNLLYNGLNISGAVHPSLIDSDTSMDVTQRAVYVGGYLIQPATVSYFNWYEQGAVTQVRDQKNCACCYSIAATGALEGQIYRKTKRLTKLSDQQIIDCSWSYGNSGCTFGNSGNVYDYIRDNGITGGVNYTLKATEGQCKYNPSMKSATCTNYRWVRITSNDFLRVRTILKIWKNLIAMFEKAQRN